MSGRAALPGELDAEVPVAGAVRVGPLVCDVCGGGCGAGVLHRVSAALPDEPAVYRHWRCRPAEVA